MKVWFAADIPSSSFGGVARSIRELAHGLSSRGHDTTIVYCPAWLKDNYVLFSLYVALRLTLSCFSPPDWLIARSSDSLVAALLCRALKLRTKVALHNHGWEEHVFACERRLPRNIVTSPTTWKARLIRFTLLRLALFASDACISGTLEQIRWLSKRYPTLRNRMAYVPNGITVGQSCHWVDTRQTPPHFLCIGGPTWKKNLEYSIAVFRTLRTHLHNARLFLVGTGVAMPRGLLEADGDSENPLVNQSRVEPDSMHVWYRQCPYLLAFPRYEGGHSLAVLEAMSYGMLVFVSPIASTMEFVRDGRNGFVLAGNDADADAESIRHVLNNSELCFSVRVKAHSSSMHHTWTRQVRRLEAMLWERIQRPPSR